MKKISLILFSILLFFVIFGCYEVSNNPGFSPDKELRNTIELKESGICSDGSCRYIWGDGEFILSEKKQIKTEKQFFTTNPFGVYHVEGGEEFFEKLDVDLRVNYDFTNIRRGGNERIKRFDESMAKNTGDNVFTLIPAKIVNISDAAVAYKYCILKDEELKEWYNFIDSFVERYDGDNDYACNILNEVDCYEEGDGLYPTNEAKENISKNPIKHWQVWNEPGVTEIDCEKAEINKNDRWPDSEYVVEIFNKAASIIKENDNEAKLISPSMIGPDPIRHDGYYSSNITTPFIQQDCKYKIQSINDIKKDRDSLAFYEYTTKIIYGVRNTADIFDIHIYSIDLYERPFYPAWVRDFLKLHGITNKAIWSTENAAPLYYFPLMGLSKPDQCQEGLGADPNSIFSEKIHAEYVIKNQIILMSSGVEKSFRFSFAAFEGEKDITVRFALLNPDGTPKPGYYSYKIMTEKLSNIKSIEQLDSYLFKAVLENEKEVFVAWNDEGKTIDLTNYIDSNLVKVTHIITESGQTDLNAKIETINANEIILNETPIFIEKVI